MDENKYKTWCVTINETDGCPLPSKEEVIKIFEQISLTYVFQLEKGEETGRLHYQCAIKLKLRRRKSTLINVIRSALLKEHQWQFTPMYGSWEEAFDYCTKADTALEPPVTNLPYYVGSDIKFLEDVSKRYPWQEYLLGELFASSLSTFKTPDDRKIYWIYDPQGNSGKSKFTKFLVLHNSLCCKVPFGTATQLRSSIISMGVKRLYIVDIPRTLGRDDDINSVITVLEDLKNGFVVSSMYGKNAQLLMDPPHVIVFSNMICPIEKMSSDRWILLTIDKDKKPTKTRYAYISTDNSDR